MADTPTIATSKRAKHVYELTLVVRTNGRPRVGSPRNSETDAEFDADAVTHFFRVLERYDVVTIDANT